MSINICFAFSIHKAGSTLFYNLLSRAMLRAGELRLSNALRYVSIPDELFNSGVPEKALMDPEFLQKHNQSIADDNALYGGFRFVPGFATDDFLAGKKIMMLVRDPRDVLTSLYFSIQKSHRLPDGQGGSAMERMRNRARIEGIDEYILGQARSGYWASRFARLGEIKDLGKSWRYEDIIFTKDRWLDEMLDYLSIDLPVASRMEFVSAEDIRPDLEDADKHIRQVTPGDHKRKLKQETIEELNQIFRKTLNTWGYV